MAGKVKALKFNADYIKKFDNVEDFLKDNKKLVEMTGKEFLVKIYEQINSKKLKVMSNDKKK